LIAPKAFENKKSSRPEGTKAIRGTTQLQPKPALKRLNAANADAYCQFQRRSSGAKVHLGTRNPLSAGDGFLFRAKSSRLLNPIYATGDYCSTALIFWQGQTSQVIFFG
jgi:hypothetical protein